MEVQFEHNILQRNIVWDKYGLMNERCTNIGASPQGRGVQRNIRTLWFWPLFSQNINAKVDNGTKVSFWHDIRIRHSPFR